MGGDHNTASAGVSTIVAEAGKEAFPETQPGVHGAHHVRPGTVPVTGPGSAEDHTHLRAPISMPLGTRELPPHSRSSGRLKANFGGNSRSGAACQLQAPAACRQLRHLRAADHNHRQTAYACVVQGQTWWVRYVGKHSTATTLCRAVVRQFHAAAPLMACNAGTAVLTGVAVPCDDLLPRTGHLA